LKQTREQRRQARDLIATGRASLAEEDDLRRERFALRMDARERPVPAGAETTQGDTVDFVDAVFLAQGVRASRAVAHVVADDGRTSLGTGFMVSPRLFLTNNHVLLDADAAEQALAVFNFELGEALEPAAPTTFALRPDLFFHTVSWEDLDFTLVAVGERRRGAGELADQGFCVLSDREDKHAKGAVVNIVQHPNGWHKKIVLRENRIVGRLDRVLHYEADTEGGSSGSPVFNDAWEVVALHHWGKPFLETRTIDGVAAPITVNEGVRISRIVETLRARLAAAASETERAYLREVLEAPAALREIGRIPRVPEGDKTVIQREKPPAADEACLIVPLEVRFRIPGLTAATPVPEVTRVDTTPRVAPEAGPEKVVLDRNYKNRRGYDASFLPGFALPLDKIVKPVRDVLAPLEDGEPQASSGELRYQHFSVFVSTKRRLALLTATNIDGATYIDINRETGLPQEGPEGETWYDDPRMDRAHYVGQRFYSANSTYFDRGHLTRRTDPTWGTKTRAVRANADTFHRTNSTPQHWLFNQSLRFWQGIERHYLEFGATIDKSRITVLQGPVFGDGDPTYEDLDGNAVKVPLLFWKVVVRVENDAPRVTGFLASHQKLLSRKRAFIQEDKTHPPDVDELVASLPRIETLTRLDLKALKPHDTWTGGPEGAESAGQKPIRSWDDLV
jgi:endonuclease G